MEYIIQLLQGLLIFACVIFLLFLGLKLVNLISKKNKKTDEELNETIEEENNSQINVIMQLEAGLKQPQNEWCNVVVFDDCVKFCFGTEIFSLANEKINSVTLKTQRQLEEEYNTTASSVMFGSNIKSKFSNLNKKKDALYLIFEFTNKQSKKENIIFNITENNSIDSLLNKYGLKIENIKEDNGEIEL